MSMSSSATDRSGQTSRRGLDHTAPVHRRGRRTLRCITQQFYGDENQWPRIFDENRDQIDDPDVISVGQVLRIPSD